MRKVEHALGVTVVPVPEVRIAVPVGTDAPSQVDAEAQALLRGYASCWEGGHRILSVVRVRGAFLLVTIGPPPAEGERTPS